MTTTRKFTTGDIINVSNSDLMLQCAVSAIDSDGMLSVKCTDVFTGETYNAAIDCEAKTLRRNESFDKATQTLIRCPEFTDLKISLAGLMSGIVLKTGSCYNIAITKRAHVDPHMSRTTVHVTNKFICLDSEFGLCRFDFPVDNGVLKICKNGRFNNVKVIEASEGINCCVASDICLLGDFTISAEFDRAFNKIYSAEIQYTNKQPCGNTNIVFRCVNKESLFPTLIEIVNDDTCYFIDDNNNLLAAIADSTDWYSFGRIIGKLVNIRKTHHCDTHDNCIFVINGTNAQKLYAQCVNDERGEYLLSDNTVVFNDYTTKSLFKSTVQTFRGYCNNEVKKYFKTDELFASYTLQQRV